MRTVLSHLVSRRRNAARVCIGARATQRACGSITNQQGQQPSQQQPQQCGQQQWRTGMM